MVSLWPWKAKSSSTASFEKTLSALSAKITHAQSRLDKTRAGARRTKVLWTLYLSFAYLVYAIVLFLVVGHRNLGAYEWTAIAGGPVLIYLIRTANAAFYSFRIDSIESRLKEYQEERAKTIQKLKDATKYDSTLELLEKYGGADRPSSSQGKGEGHGADASNNNNDAGGRSANNTPGRGTPNRILVSPPPTANIQRSPGTPVPPIQGGLSPAPLSASSTPLTAGAEFAPNAFAPSPHLPPPPPPPPAEPHWYDRIFDVLLGEDETASRNRIALICRSCRLVNGQAPPGTRSLAEVGTWKCMSCGTSNGEPDEGRKILREVVRDAQERRRESRPESNDERQDDGQEPATSGRDSSPDAGNTTTPREAHDAASEAKPKEPAAGARSRRGKSKK
ncbi:hypothetical protein HIM_06311 [Hirsutella minnesotensis 3608]|uniref:Endoplasmic reticulum junction formation protein lunapark n=1 Tax=Hirsutella minnesotensis 3608 TaxID=1043627 RepID=A0A0F7ZNT4_9HYPO|nr:hypothetical protein HIM_06311 [Hirsutella minnesotensis 3608]